MNPFMQFPDHMVPYDVFIKDLSARIVSLIKSDKDDPEYVSQRKAFSMFGRKNVERWRKQGKIIPCKRPGKVEYKTSELRLLQRTVQDYLDNTKL